MQSGRKVQIMYEVMLILHYMLIVSVHSDDPQGR